MTGILQSLLGSVSSAAASATDAYFNLVTLLLPGNGTNGAQNNTFLDSSTNNFTITRNGSTTQGTFSPFSQTGWGNYFNGSTDYFTFTPSADFAFGTGDFTVECWYYPTSAVTDEYIFDTRTSATFTGLWAFNFNWSGTDSGKLSWANNSTTLVQPTVTVATNSWNHLLYVRSGTTGSMYVNGTRVATQTDSFNYNTNPGAMRMGTRYSVTASNQYVKGYLSNVRVVKGTAVYDPTQTSITVPTTPLTAVTNTKFLTCQSNRFIDSSASALAITVNGTPSVQAFSPFAPTAAYSAATNGGSGYFDGTGDYLSLTGTSLSSGNFTVEGFVYLTTSGTSVFFDSRTSDVSTTGFAFYRNSSNYLGFFTDGTATLGSTVIPTNSWVHIALVRNSNTVYGYMNGVQQFSVANSATMSLTAWKIFSQYDNTNSPKGYLSSFRITTTAVYTAAFTPPTAPLTAITNTQLLLSATNAGITDATAKNDLETVGNAQISTTQSKFGGSSMYFDGTGDWLQIPYTATNDLGGTTAFTIEFWVYASSVNPRLCVISRNNGSTAAGSQFDVNIETTGQVSTNFYSSSSAIQPVSATGVISTNTWTHVAISKDSSGNYKIFINGTQSGSTVTNTSSINSPSLPILVGVTSSSGNNPLTGYIDDLRITRGYARYTANFTAPTAAFPLQ